MMLIKHVDLLYAYGVFCELSAAMAHQVGAVDPVEEFRFCLEPLHGPRKPATRHTSERTSRGREEWE